MMDTQIKAALHNLLDTAIQLTESSKYKFTFEYDSDRNFICIRCDDKAKIAQKDFNAEYLDYEFMDIPAINENSQEYKLAILQRMKDKMQKTANQSKED